MKGIVVRKAYIPYLFLLPAVGIIFTIIVFPVGETFRYSFYFMKLNVPWRGTPFVGLKNYLSLGSDSRFFNSLRVTFFYVVGSEIGILFLGLITALIANKTFKGRWLFRASILVPWAISAVVAAQAWKLMYNPDYGIINELLLKIGLISERYVWLGSDLSALTASVITNAWKTTPFMALVLLGGLQSLPTDIYESARIDGATRWQCFFHITLPLLMPYVYIGLLFTTLMTNNVIDIIYVLTGGGPGNSTEIMVLYNYRVLFKFMDFGFGAALSVILALITGILIALYVRGVTRYISR